MAKGYLLTHHDHNSVEFEDKDDAAGAFIFGLFLVDDSVTAKGPHSITITLRRIGLIAFDVSAPSTSPQLTIFHWSLANNGHLHDRERGCIPRSSLRCSAMERRRIVLVFIQAAGWLKAT